MSISRKMQRRMDRARSREQDQRLKRDFQNSKRQSRSYWDDYDPADGGAVFRVLTFGAREVREALSAWSNYADRYSYEVTLSIAEPMRIKLRYENETTVYVYFSHIMQAVQMWPVDYITVGESFKLLLLLGDVQRANRDVAQQRRTALVLKRQRKYYENSYE